MRPIKASEVHLFIGQVVRIVYVKDQGVGFVDGKDAIIVDNMITDAVLLKKVDPNNQTVEIERPGGILQTIKFKEIHAVSK